MERFIESQVLIPGQWKPLTPEDIKGNSARSQLIRAIENELEECKEFI